MVALQPQRAVDLLLERKAHVWVRNGSNYFHRVRDLLFVLRQVDNAKSAAADFADDRKAVALFSLNRLPNHAFVATALTTPPETPCRGKSSLTLPLRTDTSEIP